jgi:type IV pilus assembly protein PilO
MAKMPRIVTLNNLALTAGKDGTLSLDASPRPSATSTRTNWTQQAKARKAKKANKEAKA